MGAGVDNQTYPRNVYAAAEHSALDAKASQLSTQSI